MGRQLVLRHRQRSEELLSQNLAGSGWGSLTNHDVASRYNSAIMMSRTQITLGLETHRRARKRAAELGVSFAEYIRSLVARDLASPRKATDPSILFALGRSTGSDIAADKDKMIAEAFGATRAASSRAGRARRR